METIHFLSPLEIILYLKSSRTTVKAVSAAAAKSSLLQAEYDSNSTLRSELNNEILGTIRFF